MSAEWYAPACGCVKRARLFAPVTPLVAFALGLVLGPGLGILGVRDVTAAAPIIALCCGAVGSAMAARLDARAFAAPVLVSGVLGAAGVALVLLPLLHAIPATTVIYGSAVSVALLLAAVAVAPRSILAPAVLAAAIVLNPARRPPVGIGMWLVLLVLAAAVTALAFRALGTRPGTALPPAAACTTLLVGSGIGTATGASPLLVCWGAAVALGAASPGRSVLRNLVLDTERWSSGTLWFAAGLIASIPSWRALPIAAVPALVPVLLARAAAWMRVTPVRPPEPVALALAWAMALETGRGVEGAAPLVTIAALALLGLHSTPALSPAFKRLTRRRGPVEVSA